MADSAPVSEYVQQYVQSALSVEIFQMYGLTEDFGSCTSIDIYNCMEPGSVRLQVQGLPSKFENWDEGGYSIFDEGLKGIIRVGGERVSTGNFEQRVKTRSNFHEIEGKV